MLEEKIPLIELNKLKKYFPVKRGVNLKALEDVSLDIYEGYPRLYRKEYVNVKIGNRQTQVMMYVMNPDS